MSGPKHSPAENLETLRRILEQLIQYGEDANFTAYEITQEERDTFGEIVRIVNGLNMWL